MATTVTSATLKVTLKEDIVINGRQQGSESVLSIPGINEISKRIATVTTTEATILTFSSAVGPGTYIAANVKYLRLTNLDDENHVMFTFKDEDNTEFRIKVDAGHSFVYPGDNAGGFVDTMKASNAALASGLSDLYDVTADADTASCDIEIFVASV